MPASHDSSVNRALLNEAERKNLEPDNLTLPLGPPSGYVVRFTNGMVVYLTGDTALHADMKTVVADFHKPNVMVLNLGLSAITTASGVQIAELVQPATVIISHPQRGRVGRRQDASRLAHRRHLREAAQRSRTRDLRPDDGVRRTGQVRGRLQLTSRA